MVNTPVAATFRAIATGVDLAAEQVRRHEFIVAPASWQALTKAEREYRAWLPPRSVVDFVHMVPFGRGLGLDARDIVAALAQRQRGNKAGQALAGQEHTKLTDEAPARLGKLQFPGTQPSVLHAHGTEVTVVQINWARFTNEEIVQAFREWVPAARPPELPAPSGKGHKPGDWRAKLTRLAVLRLLAGASALQIVDDRQKRFAQVWQTRQFAGDQWADVAKWHAARREAGRVCRALFPFLPAADKPLAWGRQEPGK
jgi:hypothetical protein